MNITLIGHGNVGSALARRWAEAGHAITIGARDLQQEKLLRLLASHANIHAANLNESLRAAEVIVVAVPAPAVPALARELGDLSGHIVIDTTNSVFPKPEPFATGFEALQQLTGAAVAKCFNATGAENMAAPRYAIETPSPHEVPIDMFAAGSDARAKAVAMQLATDAGFVCYDFGGDDAVPLLEEVCRIWIHLAMKQGLGRGIALKLLRR